MYIGTIESVPALLKVLEKHPPSTYSPCKNDLEIPPQPPPLIINGIVVVAAPQRENPAKDCSPKKIYICTYAHAISALRKITGQNFVDYEDWKKWWNEHLTSKEKSE